MACAWSSRVSEDIALIYNKFSRGTWFWETANKRSLVILRRGTATLNTAAGQAGKETPLKFIEGRFRKAQHMLISPDGHFVGIVVSSSDRGLYFISYQVIRNTSDCTYTKLTWCRAVKPSSFATSGPTPLDSSFSTERCKNAFPIEVQLKYSTVVETRLLK